MDLAAWLAAVAAVLSAAVGVGLAVRIARSKERKAADAEITDLSTTLTKCRDDLVRTTAYAHHLRIRLSQRGETTPPIETWEPPP